MEAAESLWKMESALERLGVEFIPGDRKKGLGVRLRKPKEVTGERLWRGLSGVPTFRRG